MWRLSPCVNFSGHGHELTNNIINGSILFSTRHVSHSLGLIMALHAWMPLTDNAKSENDAFFNSPSPPSAVHLALAGFRGSSAPPVLYRASKPSTFSYFRSGKVRPASSFAESGPHSQRTWKSDHETHLFVGKKYRHTPASSEYDSLVPTSGRSSMDTITKELSIGQPYRYSSQRTSSQLSVDGKKASQRYSVTIQHASEDEKTYISFRETRPSDAEHLSPYAAHPSHEVSRPWSFPYFLPMPLKRVLTRHTWTDCDDPQSMEEEYSQYSTTPRSTDYQPFLRDSPDIQQHRGLALEIWKSFSTETSSVPSSMRIGTGMHRRLPTVSSLSVSEASCPIAQATRNIISSQRQMIDIDAIEKGYSYNSTPPEDAFWSIQTILFLFGFLAFPCWWIGAFAPSDPDVLKAYNVSSVQYNHDPIHYGSTTRHLPPSPSIVIRPIHQQRVTAKSTMKQNFQQLNRVMTGVSMVVGLLVAGLLIWYKLDIDK
ncbi:hypothetical protein K450DRAFT_247647 [Umbelopsis ramanniana AG]|uniref:Uncharacterized protein n=1 Tax=Umbelopsis ramanniana AG TaxID=1314678 RepID=A0AAD5HBU5_UMBRA|nr:uncharacterized protein K450DRAFT_247647 [Umbelopsis ramanniana AG]KAI8578387.1 hypothetical protein K450DRAFT_247647 [Umbelopsis ramanniana AG]